MKIIRKILWFLVYLLPAALFFSYHPVISLGSDASMNFELSIPLLWLVIFDILAFVLLIMMKIAERKTSFSSPAAAFATNEERTERASTRNDGLRERTQRRRKTRRSGWGANFPGLSDRRFFLFALFPLYLTISVFWSPNPLRGLLTAGIVWLIFFAVFTLLYLLPVSGTPRRLRFHTLIVMFIATVLVCKFCYAQSIMDVLGLSRDNTLLCLGCTYRSFGFPHPSGFAIEPQFMGNLLLAPTLTALYLVAFRSRKFGRNMVNEAVYLEHKVEKDLLRDKIHLPEPNWKKWQYVGMVILTGFLSMTLFFTFSRGAIYAYAVAILVLLIFALKRHQFRWSLITIPVVSFLLSLSLQGTFAAVGPTAETFVSGVTKSIHQLSLGLIDLRPQSAGGHESSSSVDSSVENSSNPVDNSAPNSGKPVQNSPESVENHQETVEKIAETVDKAVENHVERSEAEAEKTLEDAIFEGYVPESTNIRLNLNTVAVETWLSAPGHAPLEFGCARATSAEDATCLLSTDLTPTSILFGVGLGGAGTAMHAKSPDVVTSPKEIVQNEPFSLLLETGLIGIALAIFGLLIAFCPQIFSRKFLDGRAATSEVSAESPQTSDTFWHHPAIPLLVALIIAYLITLNFFSGLPNALQIYLMPPLLYLIFSDQYLPARPTKTSKSKSSMPPKILPAKSPKPSQYLQISQTPQDPQTQALLNLLEQGKAPLSIRGACTRC